MTGCASCTCSRPATSAPCGRLLLASGVAHTVTALRSAASALGARTVERAPGLLEVLGPDPDTAVPALRASLSSVEAAEVRAVVLARDARVDTQLAAALTAPTLDQVAARTEHADLLPLFADELASFRSVYQPIVRLDDERRVVGHEALLRATGADGPLSPAVLFGAAERAGWLHVLDRVGRTTALRGAAGWLGDDLLFVNFLPTTIYRPQVCLRTTEKAAREAGLRLDQLVFEVVESQQIDDLGHLRDVFAYYRERGCKVALDDLGAGYSSLTMLVQLQPDVVKLDKEIVQALPQAAASAVVKAVVDITHSYGGLVLAECVETAEQADVARQLGVDLGQGWFFGKPVERATAVAPARRAARPARFTGDDPAVQVQPAPAPPAPLRGGADVEALLTGAVDLTSVGVVIVDAAAPDMPVVHVNAAFEQMSGYRAADVLGRNCRVVQGPETDRTVVAGIRTAVDAGATHTAVLRNSRPDGTTWWNELHLSPVRDAAGTVTHYFGFQHDVTARVEAEQVAERLAYSDVLTGLPNRAGVLRALDVLVRAGEPFAVLFVDLDGLKAVNDRAGHAAGDAALQAAAGVLTGALRGGDTVGRISGDEFVALLPGGGEAVATRIARAALDAGLAASVGVALFPDHGGSPESLLSAADSAMYDAKRSGGGRAACAVPAPRTGADALV